MAIAIKTAVQIDGIRASCRLARATLDWAGNFVKPGVTTGELNRVCHEYIHENGATSACLGYRGFPKSVCTSVNEVVCHGIPGDRVLADGDIVNLDVTTVLGGYYGDTSRMYAVGTVGGEAVRLMTAAEKCLEVGIGQVRPGCKFGVIGQAIEAYARLVGFSVVYEFCGHGTGLSFHEEPQVMHDNRTFDQRRMRAGMVFTIEPMINAGVPEVLMDPADGWTVRTADGRLSAQYEHTVLVCDGGCEVLTGGP